MARLLRNGHLNVRNYRVDFVRVCLDDINDTVEENIRYNSLATRLSKLEEKDFTKFMKDIEPKGQKKPIIVDHEAQMKKSQGKIK